MISKLEESVVMLLTGGIIYFYFEIFVRGYSHISMFILGGVCFYLVGRVGNGILFGKGCFIVRILKIMLMSGILITNLEFITGFVVNKIMGLSVWDYSQMKYNLMGQICLLYSLIWSLLGLPCVYFFGVIRNYLIDKRIDRT